MQKIAVIEQIPEDEVKNLRPCDYFDMMVGTSTGGQVEYDTGHEVH